MESSPEEEQKKDLSEKPRKVLIEEGYRSLSTLNYQEGNKYFGAAIRKARRYGLWDIEAEFYKSLSLYFESNMSEAINRCVVCLNALHNQMQSQEKTTEEGHDTDANVSLPYEETVEVLEKILRHMMLRNNYGLFSLTLHLWQVDKGVTYQLKRPVPLLKALWTAWEIQRTPFFLGLDTLRNEMKLFGALTDQEIKEHEEEEADDSEKAVEDAFLSLEKPLDEEAEAYAEYSDELKAVIKFGGLAGEDGLAADLDEEMHSEISRICETTEHTADILWVYNMFTQKNLPEGILAMYAMALARNRVIRGSKPGKGNADIMVVREFVFSKMEGLMGN